MRLHHGSEVLRRGRIGWTVEEALAIDGAPLLQLLLHLVGHHLLAEAHLAELRRAGAVVVLVASTGLALV